MGSAQEMMKHIGKRVKFPVGKTGDCYCFGHIVDTKMAYGNYTMLIKPEAGQGQFWTQTWSAID